MSWLVHRICKACGRRFSATVNAHEKLPDKCDDCKEDDHAS